MPFLPKIINVFIQKVKVAAINFLEFVLFSFFFLPFFFFNCENMETTSNSPFGDYFNVYIYIHTDLFSIPLIWGENTVIIL